MLYQQIVLWHHEPLQGSFRQLWRPVRQFIRLQQRVCLSIIALGQASLCATLSLGPLLPAESLQVEDERATWQPCMAAAQYMAVIMDVQMCIAQQSDAGQVAAW